MAADWSSAIKFLGFQPNMLYHEIYAIGYNEFLKAVSALKETLIQEFPEKQEAIEESCGRMLKSYSEEYDEKWFAKFVEYCSGNIFVVSPRIPLYDAELEAVEENGQAPEKAVNLHQSIKATANLNKKLLERLQELDTEIKKRKELLARVVKTEKKMELVKRVKELEQQLNSVAEQLPEYGQGN